MLCLAACVLFKCLVNLLAKSNNTGGRNDISEIIFLQFCVGSRGESRVNGPLKKDVESSDAHSVWQQAASESARAYGWISHSAAVGQGEQIKGAKDTNLEEAGGSLVLLLLEQLICFLFFSPTVSKVGG